MYQLGTIIFCLAVVHPFLCYGEVNISDEPILDYLNMNPAHVIEHELVHINLSEHKHKRASGSNQNRQGTAMRFRAFGKDINLWLHPRDSLLASEETPVYFAYESYYVRGKVMYKLEKDAMKKVGQLYEDPKHYASVVIGSELRNDQPTVTANIRSRRDNTALVIRSLPEEVVEQHLRKRRSVNGYNRDNSLYSARHVVLRVKDSTPLYNIGEGYGKVNVHGMSDVPFSSIRANNSNDYPRSLYPKIFVHIDSTYPQQSLRFSGKDFKLIHLLEYVLAFWNGVDLSYRHLENPNFRFHIGGIAIAMSPAATPYLFTAKNIQDGTIDPHKAIDNARRFYYAVRNQIPFDIYNVAVTMTQLPLKKPILGIANVGAVCDDPIASGHREAVALVGDDGAFGGIDTAVHEVGHSFGLAHDTKNPVCDNSLGFIMGSASNPTKNTTTFSECSLAQFNAILQQGDLKCLYNPPQIRSPILPKPLPGRILTLDQQCQARNYMKACGYDAADPCVEIYCTARIKNVSGGILETCRPLNHGAAPGTPCGSRRDPQPRFCLQSRCVSLN